MFIQLNKCVQMIRRKWNVCKLKENKTKRYLFYTSMQMKWWQQKIYKTDRKWLNVEYIYIFINDIFSLTVV